MSYHHKSMEGYISPRCVTAMPGCDDLACVCVCHLGRRRHDPGALMEEPDLHPKTFDPEDERRADDAHMAAMEAQMEHDAEQGEGDDRG